MRRVAVVAIQHPSLPNLFLHGKRRDNKRWAMPGGHANPGETPHDNARRELREETGLMIKEMEHCRNGCFVAPEGDKVDVSLFMCSAPQDLDVDAHKDPDYEFSEFKWLDPSNEEYDFHVPADRNLLVRHLAFKKIELSTFLKSPASEESSKAKKADPYQYDVRFKGFNPVVDRKGDYRAYEFSKKDLAKILGNWDKAAQWKAMSFARQSKNSAHHGTAKHRSSVSKPLRDHFKRSGGKIKDKKILYHGFGRDNVGAKALQNGFDIISEENYKPDAKHNEVHVYDPFHPVAGATHIPHDTFDHVHSHFTLNVVNKDTGRHILQEIHDRLHPEGKAIISVRGDLVPKLKKGEGDDVLEKMLGVKYQTRHTFQGVGKDPTKDSFRVNAYDQKGNHTGHAYVINRSDHVTLHNFDYHPDHEYNKRQILKQIKEHAENISKKPAKKLEKAEKSLKNNLIATSVFGMMKSEDIDERANVRVEGRVFVAMDGDNIGASVERAAMSDDLQTIIQQSKIIALGQKIIRAWAKKYDADIYIDGGDDIAMTVPKDAVKVLEVVRQAYQKATGFTITIGYGDSISHAGHAMLYGKLHGKNQINKWTQDLEDKLDDVARDLTPKEKYAEEGLLGKEEILQSARIKKQVPGKWL